MLCGTIRDYNIVGAKKAGSWLILQSMHLVINGLVSLGRVLKVSEERVE